MNSHLLSLKIIKGNSLQVTLTPTQNIQYHPLFSQSWIGIYVIKREKHSHYHRSQLITKTNYSSIVFDNLNDGWYDVRYFKRNEDLIASTSICIGEQVIPEIITSINQLKILILFNQEQLLPNDWFGIFESSQTSQKKALKT